MAQKMPEFRGWLAEVRGIRNFAGLTEQQEATYFKDFVEDFNTATLPHEKWYDLSAWEAKGGYVGAFAGVLFDDEREREAQLRAEAERRRVNLVQEAYKKIITDRGLADAMKNQRYLKEKAEQYFREGRNDEALKIIARLKPDKPILHLREEKPIHNDYDC